MLLTHNTFSSRSSVFSSLYGTQLTVASHLGAPGRKFFTLSALKPMDIYYTCHNLAQKKWGSVLSVLSARKIWATERKWRGLTWNWLNLKQQMFIWCDSFCLHTMLHFREASRFVLSVSDAVIFAVLQWLCSLRIITVLFLSSGSEAFTQWETAMLTRYLLKSTLWNTMLM